MMMEGETEVGTAGTRVAREDARTMELKNVLAGIGAVRADGNGGAANARVTGVVCDSRVVAPGNLFFALPGAKADGNEFVGAAIARGATAIASAMPRPANAPAQVTWIDLAPHTERKALALAAANFYGHPADALKLVGVTGTNGKTTITFIVDSILHAAGFTTGRIGTTG
jgi:UDP-N-acetylmuramoyl-L-alanyl-D-glutamate--2,6-diaminopimelate ligase